MNATSESFASFILSELHIDVARNASDDFNLFHDKRRWQQIERNPFGGPIALGFQLIQFIEHQCNRYRADTNEDQIINDNRLGFSNYQFNFINAVRPNQTVSIQIKPTKHKLDIENPKISNRVVLKADNSISLMGFKSHSQRPLFGEAKDFTAVLNDKPLYDRNFIEGTQYFYKRKFSTNSDAKNFLVSGGVEQSDYFDDIANINQYSETYCSSLLSCALLEKAKSEGANFIKNPMIYTQQKISVHSHNLSMLRSAQPIHYIVDNPIKDQTTQHVSYRCWALNQNHQLLVQAELSLAPLLTILSKN